MIFLRIILKNNLQFPLDPQHILLNLPGHVYWKDKDGVYLGCNFQQARTLGHSHPKDIIGKTDFDFSLERDAKFIREIDVRVMKERKDLLVEEPALNKTKNKVVYYLSKKSPLLDYNGEVIGVVGVSLNMSTQALEMNEIISQKNQSEIALNTIISLLPGNIYWKDLNGVFLGCNQQQAEAVGFKSPSELIGKTAFDTLPKKQAEEITKVDQEIMKLGKPISKEEISDSIYSKGSIYLSKKIPLRNNKNKIIGILGISFDITDRKKMEEELRTAKEKAEQANYIKTELIANIGHDLATPISDVSSTAQILACYSDEYPELKGLIDTLLIRSAACEEVRKHIINATAISNLDVKPENFSIANELLIIEQELKPSIGSKNLKLIIHPLKPKKEEFIETDREKFHAILLDLISNAINFTEEGQVTVSVFKNDNQFSIQIADTGIGIPSDKFEYIFQQYTKLSRSNKHGLHFKGIGAGLYLARLRAHILNATISVESEVNKGSTFTLSIPAHPINN